MNFDWMDCGSGYSRCTSTEPVTVKVFAFGSTVPHNARITHMGYIMPKDGRLMACVYGSVHPESPGAWFDHTDEAKRYVEQQAMVGLTLNRLTR
jgi:hypothetical protein